MKAFLGMGIKPVIPSRAISEGGSEQPEMNRIVGIKNAAWNNFHATGYSRTQWIDFPPGERILSIMAGILTRALGMIPAPELRLPRFPQ